MKNLPGWGFVLVLGIYLLVLLVPPPVGYRRVGLETQRMSKMWTAVSAKRLRIRPNSMHTGPNKSLTARPDGTCVLSDTYAAAYLAAAGYCVQAVELGRDGRWVFTFAAGDGLADAYMNFLNNAQIGVRDFTSAMFALKRLMREAENGGASR